MTTLNLINFCADLFKQGWTYVDVYRVRDGEDLQLSACLQLLRPGMIAPGDIVCVLYGTPEVVPRNTYVVTLEVSEVFDTGIRGRVSLPEPLAHHWIGAGDWRRGNPKKD